MNWLSMEGDDVGNTIDISVLHNKNIWWIKHNIYNFLCDNFFVTISIHKGYGCNVSIRLHVKSVLGI